MPLLIGHPAQVQLLFYSVMLLQTETHRIPSCNDVVGDDTAEGVGHDGHFSSPLLKLRVAGAEKHVESVQLLGKALSNLERQVEEGFKENYRSLNVLLLDVYDSHLIPVKRTVVVHNVHGTAVE